MDASNLSYRIRKRQNHDLDNINNRIRNFVLTPDNRHELDTLEDQQQRAMAVLLEYSKSKNILNNCLSACNKSSNISKAINQKFSTPTSIICDSNDQPFESDEERAEHIVNFYKSIYSRTPTSFTSISKTLSARAMSNIPKLSHAQCNSLTTAITNEEVRRVIKALGNNTAPGLDCIPNDLIKNMYDLYIVLT